MRILKLSSKITSSQLLITFPSDESNCKLRAFFINFHMFFLRSMDIGGLVLELKDTCILDCKNKMKNKNKNNAILYVKVLANETIHTIILTAVYQQVLVHNKLHFSIIFFSYLLCNFTSVLLSKDYSPLQSTHHPFLTHV